MDKSNIYLDKLHEMRLKSWSELMNKFEYCESEKQYNLDDLLILDEYNENLKYGFNKNRNESCLLVNDSSDLYQSETDSVDSVSYVLKCKEQSKNCNKVKLKKLLDLKNNSLTTPNMSTSTSEQISDNTTLKCIDGNKTNWTYLKNKLNNNYRISEIIDSSSEDKSDHIFSDTKENKLLETPQNSIIKQTNVPSTKPNMNIEKSVYFLTQSKLEDMKKKDKEIFEKSCKANFITKMNESRLLASKLDLDRKQFHSKINLILNEKYGQFQEEPIKPICHIDLTENSTKNIQNKNAMKITDIVKKLQERGIQILGNVDAGKILPKENSINIQENCINKTIGLNETFVLDNKIYSPSKHRILAENAQINQTKLNGFVSESYENCIIGISDETMKPHLNGRTTKYTKKKDNSDQQKLKSFHVENIESENASENLVNEITQAIQKQGFVCTKYRDTLKMINPEKTNQENIPVITDPEIHGNNKELMHKRKRKLKKLREQLKSFDTENVTSELMHKNNKKLNKHRNKLKSNDAENIKTDHIHLEVSENMQKSKKKTLLEHNRENLKSIDYIKSNSNQLKLKKDRERLNRLDADNIETDESNSATSNISETSNMSTKSMPHWDKLENAGIFPNNFKKAKNDSIENHESIYTKRKRKSPAKTIELAKKQNVSYSTQTSVSPKTILTPASESVKILTLDYFLNDGIWGGSS